MAELALRGCRPEPLAFYLKALAVLRLVSEQVDPTARGFWHGEQFVLRSTLDRDGLVRFFTEAYRPTPIVAPWNGGSGFWPGDNTDGIGPIRKSDDPRFAPYRAAIEAADAVLVSVPAEDRKDKEVKGALIEALRAELPDDALAWLDAALVLTPDGVRYPPLLGTGGNDGRLDFSNNQMQRLVGLLLDGPPARRELEAALFDTPVPGLRDLTVGQFLPSGVGATNGGPGFSGRAVVNPWDFVLMVEGALLPSAAATRRLESAQGGAMSFPFTVRSSGVAYGTAAAQDEEGSRDEVWMPLWPEPATLAGVRTLFAEGRAKTVSDRGGRSTAVTGAEFSRALATLGVDRGVDRFVRFGFLQRNGLSFLATPLGVHRVQRRPLADVLAPLDPWLDLLRRVGGSKAPSAWRRARSEVERATVDLCTGARGDLLDLLLALAAAERALGRNPKAAVAAGIGPVPRLAAAHWLPHVREDSPEFRLAWSLAVGGFRRRLVAVGAGGGWDLEAKGVTFAAATLQDNLVATVQREAVEQAGRRGTGAARLDDIAAYLDHRVDDERLAKLVHALSLLDSPAEAPPLRAVGNPPDAAYALCALVWHAPPEAEVPHTPAIVSLLAGDRVSEAAATAAARLTGSGLVPLVRGVPPARGRGRRLASALAFPLSAPDWHALAVAVGARPEPEDDLE